MNCSTCRYELSQCLDGRLPSGRRAVVMQHTASCEACAGFWRELQAAQRLILELPREQVSGSFRDQLWQRIRAGEGTPEAVFHEPVPLLAKVRYALTGAAAAAAALLIALWLHDDRGGRPGPDTTEIARNEPRVEDNQPAPPPVAPTPTPVADLDPVPIINATQLFTANLLAAETARQIEARYDSVDLALRQLARQRDDTIVERILTEANDLHDFAQVLLDLRDRERLSFRDPAVDADLQLVTHMLGQVRKRTHDLETVRVWVEPALKDSQHLRDITDHITVRPTVDPREEATLLLHMVSTRSEVFPKLFIVIGQGDESGDDLGLLRSDVFLFEDPCGANYVAPISRIRRVEQRIRFRGFQIR